MSENEPRMAVLELCIGSSVGVVGFVSLVLLLVVL